MQLGRGFPYALLDTHAVLARFTKESGNAEAVLVTESSSQRALNHGEDGLRRITEARAELLHAWRRNEDGLHVVFNSALLNNAQRGSVQSTIGVRAHLMVAAHALSTGAVHERVGATDCVLLDKLRPATQYFAQAHVNDPRSAYVRRGRDVFMRQVCYDYVTAADASVRFSNYCEIVFQHLLEDGDDNLLVSLLGSELDEAVEYGACLVATEFPVYNPFVLANKQRSGARTAPRRCLLQQTQMDALFLVYAKQDPPVPPEQRRGHLVVVELKTLMEMRRPTIPDRRAQRQTLTNIALFEQVTGVACSYGVTLQATRRGPGKGLP